MAYPQPVVPGPQNKTLKHPLLGAPSSMVSSGANAGSWNRVHGLGSQNRYLAQYYGANTQPQSPGQAGQGRNFSMPPDDDAGITQQRMSPYSAVRPGTPASPARTGTGFGNGLGYGLGTDEQESPNSQYNRGMGAYSAGSGPMNASGAYGNGGWSQNDNGQWSMNTGGANVMQGGAGHGGLAGAPTQDNPNYLGNGQYRQVSSPIGQVNYGAVAGLQNYLAMLPANQQGAAAQQLRAQGLLGTYNGFAMGQAPMNNTLSSYSSGTGTGQWSAQAPGSNPSAGYFASNGDYILGNGTNTGSGGENLPPGVHRQSGNGPWGMRDGDLTYNPTGGTSRASWVPYTGAAPGAGQMLDSGGGVLPQYAGQNGFGPGQFSAVGGTGAMGMSSGAGGQTVGGAQGGGQGYPLQPQMQSAISGILSNPSPYSQQQQSMLRNSATSGVEQQARTAQQSAAEDAVRRGLNPAEAQANQQALAGQYNNQRQGALNTFELNNAQATRQGLLGGLQAGGAFTGQQMQEEASIRQYLAQLAAAQSGSAMSFLNL